MLYHLEHKQMISTQHMQQTNQQTNNLLKPTPKINPNLKECNQNLRPKYNPPKPDQANSTNANTN